MGKQGSGGNKKIGAKGAVAAGAAAGSALAGVIGGIIKIMGGGK